MMESDDSKSNDLDGSGNAEVGVQIPASWKKVVQTIKEFSGDMFTDSEIYTVLCDCNMDPNDAVQRLFSQETDGFQEKARSAIDVQAKSQSAGDVQPKSKSARDIQPKSKSARDIQPKSQSARDIQPKSRAAKDFELKSRKVTSSQNPSTANSPNMDGDEFLRQVSRRLLSEQFYAFLNNIVELNDGNQTLEETSRKATEIFGTHNLFESLTFEELLISYHYGLTTAQTDGIEFLPQARNCLFYKDLFQSFQGLLVSNQNSSAANSPPRESSDVKELIRQAWSRLSEEQLDAIVANVTELSFGKQTREEALRKVEEIFGMDNKDLFLSFEEVLNRKSY